MGDDMMQIMMKKVTRTKIGSSKQYNNWRLRLNAYKLQLRSSCP
jgi:hypothetical protein